MPVGFTTEHELALEAFSSDSYLQVNKTLMKIYGIEMAVFICNLVDKLKYFRSRNMLTEDGGFFLTHAEQTEQIGLSDYQLRRHKQKCRELGILSTKMVGIPPKEFYFLDLDVLVEVFKEYSLKNLGNDPQKIKGIYKETQSKETIKEASKEASGVRRKSSSIPVKRTRSNNHPNKSTATYPPYDEIVALWNSAVENTSIPQIKKLTSSRRAKIKARMKDFPATEDWAALFKPIIASDFLCGDNDRGWTASFDWLVANEENPTKVLEGKYANKKKKSSGPKPASHIQAEPGKYAGVKTITFDNTKF